MNWIKGQIKKIEFIKIFLQKTTRISQIQTFNKIFKDEKKY